MLFIDFEQPQRLRVLGRAADQRQVLGVLDLGVVDERAPRLAGPEAARAQAVLGNDLLAPLDG